MALLLARIRMGASAMWKCREQQLRRPLTGCCRPTAKEGPKPWRETSARGGGVTAAPYE